MNAQPRHPGSPSPSRGRHSPPSERRLPSRTTGQGYALRREGTRVLYRCHRAGHEEWYDFAKAENVRRMPKARRPEIALSLATFAIGWHSEAKGGAHIECAACLREPPKRA